MLTKEVITVCKTILRNGFDAYIVNASLQEHLYTLTQTPEVDIACEMDFDSLSKLFPTLESSQEENVLGIFTTEENTIIRFYHIDVNECAHTDTSFSRMTPHMLQLLQANNEHAYNVIKGMLYSDNPEDSFEERSSGYISFKGIAYSTLQRNYRLAITALRLAANYDLPIDPPTWLAIIRASQTISNYLPMSVFMEEMRLVAAENLWKFIQLLDQSFLLHNVLPEIAALHAVKQQKNKDDSTEISVFDYTIDCMRYYPEENLHHDWIGVVATLFHAVGKLHTAENFHGRWTFYQYHRVGAQVTRGILTRLHVPADTVETICNLVRNHIRFHSMLADKGIRRFQALPDTERLIEMARAGIKASNASYTNFNHNLKYLERADTPEQMLKPFLSGNEIMEVKHVPQGKAIGVLRDALLKAQIAGKVNNRDEAREFIRQYDIYDI